MSVSATSGIASIAAHLEQLGQLRQQQTELNLQVGESIRHARQQAAERSLQDLSKQVERVNEITRTALQTRSGSIDVWA